MLRMCAHLSHSTCQAVPLCTNMARFVRVGLSMGFIQNVNITRLCILVLFAQEDMNFILVILEPSSGVCASIN